MVAPTVCPLELWQNDSGYIEHCSLAQEGTYRQQKCCTIQLNIDL